MASEPEPWILHVDLDQFLAAVEMRRRPELRGRPVVVGGDGDPNRPRQVVATASYEARAYGVHSGMPLARAYRRCPDAVFLPSDHPAAGRVATHVGVIVRTSTFFTQVKTGKLAAPARRPGPVVAKALEILERVEIRRPARLLGVRVDLG